MILFAPRTNLILSVLLLVTLFTSLIVLAIDGDLVRRAGGDAAGVWAFNIFAAVWTWLSIVPLSVRSCHPLRGSLELTTASLTVGAQTSSCHSSTRLRPPPDSLRARKHRRSLDLLARCVPGSP